MKILAYASDLTACSWQRCLLPAHHMRAQGLADVRQTQGPTPDAWEWADVVLVQRAFTEGPYRWFLEAHARGVPLVYELDDDVFSVTDDNPFKRHYTRAVLDMMADMVRKASLVTAPCRHLTGALARLNPRSAVVPSGVDPGAFDLPRAPHDGEVRIVFSGSRTHDRDFAPLMAALPRLLRRHGHLRLVVIGNAPTGLGRTLRDHRLAGRLADTGWVDWGGAFVFHLRKGGALRCERYGEADGCYVTEDNKGTVTRLPKDGVERVETLPSFYRALAAHAPDIGVVPLKDNTFNKSKSAIKFYEYSALGACVAAAPVGIYADTIRDGANGRLVAGNAETRWERVLEELIADAPQRARLAAAARAEVRADYSYDVLARRWAEVLAGVAKGGKRAGDAAAA